MGLILLSGAAGFIGSRVADMLLEQGYDVAGIDNINDYYDVRLKHRRLEKLQKFPGFYFYRADIEDYEALNNIVKRRQPGAVIHLAARAGVRFSLEQPIACLATNALGTLNLLDLCKSYGIPQFILASTSSLYAGQEMPFTETLPVNTPASPYAASKKSAESLAYSYHYLYGINIAVLRYFTVYGPAGRPDMSIFRFIKRAISGQSLTIYGDGRQSRDFTYLDDIARGTIMALSIKDYQVINLGNNQPVRIIDVVRLIEKLVGRKAIINYGAWHKADILNTWASIDSARDLMGWHPSVNIEEGIHKTFEWFCSNWTWVKDIEPGE